MRTPASIFSIASSAALLVLVGTGCSVSYLARSAERYRSDTRELLETKESSFRGCYEEVIAADPEAAGTVTVQFEVAAETGKIGGAKSTPASTAPEALQTCVVNGLNGLELEPPDERTGMATMTFVFERG